MVAGKRSSFRGLVGFAVDSPSSGQFSIDITGIDFRAGDIGMLVWTSGVTDSTPGVSPAMTELLNNGNSFAYSMTMVGNETAITSTTMSHDGVRPIFAIFRGFAKPTAVSANIAGTSPANPGAVTAAVNDLVLVTSHYVVGVTDTAPSGYTLVSSGSATNGSTGLAYKKALSAGSEDPGAWGVTSGAATYRALTILLEVV